MEKWGQLLLKWWERVTDDIGTYLYLEWYSVDLLQIQLNSNLHAWCLLQYHIPPMKVNMCNDGWEERRFLADIISTNMTKLLVCTWHDTFSTRKCFGTLLPWFCYCQLPPSPNMFFSICWFAFVIHDWFYCMWSNLFRIYVW